MDTADSVPTVGEVDIFLEKHDCAIALSREDLKLRNHTMKILHGLVHLARSYPHGDFYNEPLPEHLQDSFDVIQKALAEKR